jgi:hypothetical protein
MKKAGRDIGFVATATNEQYHYQIQPVSAGAIVSSGGSGSYGQPTISFGMISRPVSNSHSIVEKRGAPARR